MNCIWVIENQIRECALRLKEGSEASTVDIEYLLLQNTSIEKDRVEKIIYEVLGSVFYEFYIEDNPFKMCKTLRIRKI